MTVMNEKNNPHKLLLRHQFALNLKRVREYRGLSQEALADLSGLHRTYVGSVERGERNISIDNIEKLSIALNVCPEDLLGNNNGI